MTFEAAATPSDPPRPWRVKVSVGAGVAACLFVLALYARQRPGVISDWDPTWVGTTARTSRVGTPSQRSHPSQVLSGVPASAWWKRAAVAVTR